MTYYNAPARTEEKHRANQKPLTCLPSKQRMCYGPRCRHGRGQLRSIQQFMNRAGKPVYGLCELCRGAA